MMYSYLLKISECKNPLLSRYGGDNFSIALGLQQPRLEATDSHFLKRVSIEDKSSAAHDGLKYERNCHETKEDEKTRFNSESNLRPATFRDNAQPLRYSDF
jgi:hypothetical protein